MLVGINLFVKQTSVGWRKSVREISDMTVSPIFPQILSGLKGPEIFLFSLEKLL